MTHDLYISGIAQIKAYRILQTKVADVVKDNGLGSVSEWFVLSHVYAGHEVMAKDIAALLNVEAPLITRLVNNLLHNGLVTISAHPTDKRIKFISPTKQAQDLIPKVQLALVQVLQKSLAGVEERDLESYQKVLETIIKNGESS